MHSNVCLLFKIINNAVAPPLKKFITLNSEKKRATRSATRGECNIPNRKTSFGKSTFAFVAITQWNTLPTHLITCTNPLTFSNLTKAWLLSQQNCTHL